MLRTISLQIFTALFLTPCILFAEVVKNETIVQADQTNEPILLLSKGVYFDCDYPDQDKVRIGLDVFVSRNDFMPNDRIRKGAVLFNSNDIKIAEALTDFEVLLPGDEFPNKIQVFIRGYIPSFSIDPQSVPEYELDSLILNAQGEVPAQSLYNHAIKFRYRSWTSRDGFTSSVKFDSELISSPAVRAILVYRGESLFAILHPNTLRKSPYYPLKKGRYAVQYFTKDKKLIRNFEKGFYSQLMLAG